MNNDLRDQLAIKDASPYHETEAARIIAFKNGWDACLENLSGTASKEKEYREALIEVDEYLSQINYEKGKPVYLNSVGAMSILHQKIKEALNK